VVDPETPGAVDAALRALRYRDLSATDLEHRLAAKGYDEMERADALATLQRTGLQDDRRFAESRAESLAARGAGDALVRHELVRAGVDDELVAEAIALLEPEHARALRIAERRGHGPKTARYLSGKGFSDDSIGAVVASSDGDELG
jgi:SOS response regulatory protein OraA/RecX